MDVPLVAVMDPAEVTNVQDVILIELRVVVLALAVQATWMRDIFRFAWVCK